MTETWIWTCRLKVEHWKGEHRPRSRIGRGHRELSMAPSWSKNQGMLLESELEVWCLRAEADEDWAS